MNDFNVSVVGISTDHTKDFVVDKKNGLDEWLIMCFSTPFEILTLNGVEQGEKGDCILLSPSFPQYHCSIKDAETGFVNSWMHCNGIIINQLINQYELPLNTIIKLRSPGFFIKTLAEIKLELLKKPPHYGENISLCFKKLILSISRENINYKKSPLGPDSYHDTLEDIRNQMLLRFNTNWTVECLADKVKLSTSHFASLYKSTFGVSPIDDLINTRIKEAQVMLLSTDNTVEQIAYDCGFSSLYYFSRIFKKRIGVSPSLFRGY